LSIVVLKVGGEPVAVLVDPTEDRIKVVKDSLKDLWPDERVTVKTKI